MLNLYKSGTKLSCLHWRANTAQHSVSLCSMHYDGLLQGNENCLTDIMFTTEEMIQAIDELDSYAATADEEIPADILKGCKDALYIPLTMLWKWSMASGNLPPRLKEQFITPVYEKWAKTDLGKGNQKNTGCPLTHLEENDLLTDTQHGFRKGRSCLTQLLQHYEEINNLVHGYETDVLTALLKLCESI